MIQVHSVAVGHGGRAVLDDVSLALEPGRITAIIGPNGCGKSTLMRAIAGLLPVMSGEIRLDGQPLPRWPRKALARRLAMLPQSPVAPEGMSVRRVIEHGRYAHQGFFGGVSHEDRAVVQWAIDQMRLGELAEQPFRQLSGGERQRGWIALALAQRPAWLLLDEPTTYLDVGHQYEVLELLAGLNRSEGVGIVMVLHDINQAATYADRLIALRKGAVLADGPPGAVVTPDVVRALFGIDVEVISVGHGRPHCVPTSTR